MKYASILVVEDDPISSAVLAGWARQQGSTVVTVESTGEADSALADNSFDLVLSDVHLPGNHRLEWVEKVLAAEFPPPIILVTGNPELETTLRAANLPVAGYLVKPVDFVSLGRLVHRLVAEHRHRRELRTLSREAAWLLTDSLSHPPGGAGALHEKLQKLSLALAAEASRSPRETGRTHPDEAWRSVITETIAVLEKTKHSFRSKELGELRQRLQRVVVSDTAPKLLASAAA